ncbi:MAG TPA: hypothetical protein VFT47_10490 [Vicinamibacterales bacterium]|nr:hypothetical protein [Vicinamibacterales bacterium]
MRRLTILVPLAVAFAVTASEAAKPASKPAGAGKPTITKTSPSKGPTVKATGASGSKSVKPAKTTTQVAKGGGQTKVSGAKADKSMKPQGAQAKADAKATKAEGRTAKSGSSTTTSTTDGTPSVTSPSSTTTTTTTTSTPAIDFTATKVGAKLEKNSTLRSKIEAKLQAAGYTGTAYEAGYGFKNVGQLNAATNQVQNQGVSFNLLKVLMTGTYVDPVTHNVYRAQTLPNGTVQLVKPELATNTPSTLSLGQAKQSIAGGAVMPEIVPYTTTTSTTTTSTTTTSTTTSTSKTSTSPTATGGAASTTTGKSKPRKSYGNVPTGGSL